MAGKGQNNDDKYAKSKYDESKGVGSQNLDVTENASHRSASDQDSEMSQQGACAVLSEMNETQPKSHHLDNLRDTSQDISLNDRITRQTSAIPTKTSTSSSQSTVNLTSPAEPHLQMNIPPSLPSERMNNTAIPVGMAEEQLSFQEVPPSVAIPYALENPLSTMPLSTNTNMTRNSGTEDNTAESNISVSNVLGSAEMSARPVSAEGATARPTAGSVLSHSESRLSLKSLILPDCQVRKLPRSILMFIEVEMKKSWEDLVEHYGWNFNDTRLFYAQHPNDAFLALLKEPPFQTYTLNKFQEDLKILPRLDLLLDLEEKIQAHNAQI